MKAKEYRYIRRETSPARIGAHLQIGGGAPIVVQSMTNVDTNDIEAGVAQSVRIIEAGGKLIRFTAQGRREAQSLGAVKEQLVAKGYQEPLVADIHFNPKAAYEAAIHVDKVRINPGNFFDPAKRFQQIEYSEEEYQMEVALLQEHFSNFLDHLETHHTALRIGVNHGSLSDRIMSRYGDTPLGMVESCMEYLRVCHERNFMNVVISIKSSNALVMVETVELLITQMTSEGMRFPLHLGVTEAGDGEDGRVKSAVGIGALLSNGVGDTIRVSLSEEPEAEIPVARRLVALTEELEKCESIMVEQPLTAPYRSQEKPLVVQYASSDFVSLPHDERPDLLILREGDDKDKYVDFECIPESDVLFLTDNEALKGEGVVDKRLVIIRLQHPNIPEMLRALDDALNFPYIIEYTSETSEDLFPVDAGFHLGATLMRGQSNGILLSHPTLSSTDLCRISFGLLQASRRRISRTEFIACPSCGRTLFNLPETLARVKQATNHLKGLKIGVMGCIVNGPGEMADADYGYVGAGPGKIDLYKGKECVRKGIPTSEAVDQLLALIQENGDWKEPK